MSFSEDLDRQRAQIMRAVRQAGNDWAEAMRAHKLAPPDEGFADRLRKLSEAAAAEQIARHRPARTRGSLDPVRPCGYRDEPRDRHT